MNGQGQREACLPLVRDAVGDLATVARLGRIPAPEMTADQEQQTAGAKSDTQAAMEMREAKRKLFASWQHRGAAE